MRWSTNGEAREIEAMQADLDEKDLSDRMQAIRNSVVSQLPCKNPVPLQNADDLFKIILGFRVYLGGLLAVTASMR